MQFDAPLGTAPFALSVLANGSTGAGVSAEQFGMLSALAPQRIDLVLRDVDLAHGCDARGEDGSGVI